MKLILEIFLFALLVLSIVGFLSLMYVSFCEIFKFKPIEQWKKRQSLRKNERHVFYRSKDLLTILEKLFYFETKERYRNPTGWMTEVNRSQLINEYMVSKETVIEVGIELNKPYFFFEEDGFSYVVRVIEDKEFDPEYKVEKAYLIPHSPFTVILTEMLFRKKRKDYKKLEIKLKEEKWF